MNGWFIDTNTGRYIKRLTIFDFIIRENPLIIVIIVQSLDEILVFGGWVFVNMFLG